MHWLCSRLEPSTTVTPPEIWNSTVPPLVFSNLSLDSSEIEGGSNLSTDVPMSHDTYDQWEFVDYQKLVFVPALCVCGVIGNLLNIIILTKKIREGMYTLQVAIEPVE